MRSPQARSELSRLGQSGLSIQEILSALQIPEASAMRGKIRTEQHCPACGRPYTLMPPIGFWCEADRQIANRYYIDLFFKKQIKIYSDRTGQALDSYQRAVRMLEEINYEIKDHRFDPTRYIRIEAREFYIDRLLDRFHDEKKKTIAPSYRSNYATMVEAAKEHFGNADIREIRKIDLIGYQQKVRDQGVGDKTLWNYLAHFRAFLNWVRTDLELIQVLPAFPQVQKQEPATRWLSRDDQITLFEAVPPADRPIISLLFLTGCRPGEARALRCKDVDPRLDVIRISATWSLYEVRDRRKGRGSRALEIPIHPELRDYVQGRIKEALPAAWLFPNPRTGEAYTVSGLRRLWARIKKAAGISGIRLYDAGRHSFGSQLGAAGEGIKQISDLLGHSSLRMTERYVHPDLQAKRAALEKMSLKKILPFERRENEAKRN